MCLAVGGFNVVGAVLGGGRHLGIGYAVSSHRTATIYEHERDMYVFNE
jgi:hypothetical protein